jgi:hypothetical protein
MGNFDEMLKRKVESEPIVAPVGFSKRIDQILADLPNKELRRSPQKTLFKVLFTAAVIMGLAAMTVFATPYGTEMASGVISYFKAPHEFKYISKQAAYEKYNREVGVSTADQGITLTLDNIAVDDNYINIFYTVQNKSPISLVGDEESPEQWRINWTAPHFWFKENGRYIEPPAQGEVEAYLKDAYTLKGMQRLAIMDTLDDTVNLELYTNEIFNQKGQWHIPVSIDKSSAAVASLTVTPNLKAQVTTGWNKEYTHNITIEKVSISPFGSQIVLGERAKNTFHQFALRDENGNYLTVIPAATYGGSSLMKATNSFEFIGGRTDMAELTIVPIISAADNDNLPAPQLVALDIGSYPIKMPISEVGGFVLDSLKISSKKAVATFHQEGAVEIIAPNLMLLDENGKQLNFTAYQDEVYNRETGEITITHTFRGVTEADIAKIKKVGYFTRPQRLNEDETITIKLK